MSDYISSVEIDGTQKTITVDLSEIPFYVSLSEYNHVADFDYLGYWRCAYGDEIVLSLDSIDDGDDVAYRYYIFLYPFTFNKGPESTLLDVNDIPDGTIVNFEISIGYPRAKDNYWIGGLQYFSHCWSNNDGVINGISSTIADYSQLWDDTLEVMSFTFSNDLSLGDADFYSCWWRFADVRPYSDLEFSISPKSFSLTFTYDMLENMVVEQGEMNDTLKAILAEAIETNESLYDIELLLREILAKMDSVGNCDHSGVEELLQQISDKQDQELSWLEKIWNAISSLGEQVSTGVQSALDNIETTVTDIFTGGDAGDDLISGGDVIENAGDGLGEDLENIQDFEDQYFAEFDNALDDIIAGADLNYLVSPLAFVQMYLDKIVAGVPSQFLVVFTLPILFGVFLYIVGHPIRAPRLDTSGDTVTRETFRETTVLSGPHKGAVTSTRTVTTSTEIGRVHNE